MAEGRTAFDVDPDGWYVEPPAATHFLLAFEYFTGGIWDPACGQGNIVQACLLDGKDAVGSDLRCRVDTSNRLATPSWFLGTQEFLAFAGAAPRPNIICNAPYGRAKLCEAFIRKALALEGVQKAAFFVNAKFLFGSGRAMGLYADHPPDRVYPVFPRPSCPPGQFLLDGGKAEGGVENFVWLVYDVAAPTGRTEIIWAGRGVGAPDRHSQTPPGDSAAECGSAETIHTPAPTLRRRRKA